MYSDFSGRKFEKWLYPGSDTEKIYDAEVFAKDKGLDKLKVYLDCGSVNEPFLVGAQSLYDTLIERGFSVEFHMHNGGHTLQAGKLGEYLLFYSGMCH